MLLWYEAVRMGEHGPMYTPDHSAHVKLVFEWHSETKLFVVFDPEQDEISHSEHELLPEWEHENTTWRWTYTGVLGREWRPPTS